MTANFYNFFLKTGYVNGGLANGIGRFVPQCQRITLKFCKESGGSQGVREFIEHDLVDFARANPSIVIYLKPRRHRSAVIVSEYLNGHRDWKNFHCVTREEVRKWTHHYRSSSGTGEMRYKKFQRTEHPTIQGVWDPFTHKSPDKANMKFPVKELSEPANLPPTTTEILLELRKQQEKNVKAAVNA